jgi:hypothetical protein
MALLRLPQKPEIAAIRCAFVAVAAALLMIIINWQLIPTLVRHLGPRQRGFRVVYSSLQLASDLGASFVVALILMWLARAVAGSYGIVAPAVMAVIGWGRYFTEVGFFSGMLHSEYAWWYEVGSFVKYWLALYVCFRALPGLLGAQSRYQKAAVHE